MIFNCHHRRHRHHNRSYTNALHQHSLDSTTDVSTENFITPTPTVISNPTLAVPTFLLTLPTLSPTPTPPHPSSIPYATPSQVRSYTYYNPPTLTHTSAATPTPPPTEGLAPAIIAFVYLIYLVQRLLLHSISWCEWAAGSPKDDGKNVEEGKKDEKGKPKLTLIIPPTDPSHLVDAAIAKPKPKPKRNREQFWFLDCNDEWWVDDARGVWKLGGEGGWYWPGVGEKSGREGGRGDTKVGRGECNWDWRGKWVGSEGGGEGEGKGKGKEERDLRRETAGV